MKVTVQGKVLEKYVRPSKDGSERMYVRLYQEGERINLDVNVKAQTFAEVQPGQTIELKDVIVSVFNNYLYARQ